jgi:rubrerythrin
VTGRPIPTSVKTLQAAYIAESLAVVVYEAILKNFSHFDNPQLENKDYFVAALGNEKDHKALHAKALGSATPKDLQFHIPAKVTRTGSRCSTPASRWRRRLSRPTSGRSRR